MSTDGYYIVIKGTPRTFLDEDGQPTEDQARACKLPGDEASKRAVAYGRAIAVSESALLLHLSGVVADTLLDGAARRHKDFKAARAG